MQVRHGGSGPFPLDAELVPSRPLPLPLRWLPVHSPTRRSRRHGRNLTVDSSSRLRRCRIIPAANSGRSTPDDRSARSSRNQILRRRACRSRRRDTVRDTSPDSVTFNSTGPSMSATYRNAPPRARVLHYSTSPHRLTQAEDDLMGSTCGHLLRSAQLLKIPNRRFPGQSDCTGACSGRRNGCARRSGY